MEIAADWRFLANGRPPLFEKAPGGSIQNGKANSSIRSTRAPAATGNGCDIPEIPLLLPDSHFRHGWEEGDGVEGGERNDEK